MAYFRVTIGQNLTLDEKNKSKIPENVGQRVQWQNDYILFSHLFRNGIILM